MQYLRDRGVNFNGSAEDLPTEDTPTIGSIVKFFYKSTGTYHGAELVGWTENGFLVDDANYEPCKETRRREVMWDSESLLGFSNPNNL